MNMIKYGEPYRYRDLCEIFNDEIFRGSQQASQLNKWGKEYDIEKIERGKYIIHKKYTNIELQDNELRGTYLKLFSYVLSNLLLSTKDNSVAYSTMEILNRTHMVNSDYGFCRYNIDDSSIVLETDPNDLEIYINKSHTLLSRLVKDMLASLEDKSLIIARKGYRLYKTENGFMKFKDLILGSKDEGEILKIENNTLKEMNVENLQSVYKNEYLVSQFKKSAQRKCKGIFEGWDGYFTIHHITLNREGLKRYNSETYIELNEKVKSKILASKVLNNLVELPKYVEATISPARPYQIKETIK